MRRVRGRGHGGAVLRSQPSWFRSKIATNVTVIINLHREDWDGRRKRTILLYLQRKPLQNAKYRFRRDIDMWPIGMHDFVPPASPFLATVLQENMAKCENIIIGRRLSQAIC
ncbi:hypothetical protein K505DRAFT_325287 [Melanomma pulvis-pyrius CBS 109.77]|uniref:Uncharacterized protein n=1 Tax=Melanomma pulvis-pyrius CBS 109.77 TaxID=1314802 RepID=A0A6A6XBS3_9PLEO|nr:hypothetical protein K505DRAFT_325287 [Melanomma pulvis-pyrius CBS 109.77]